MSKTQRPLGPRERWIFGGLFVGMGLFIVWLSLSDPSSVNGPWWIGTSAGLVFAAAGMSAGTQGTRAGTWVTPGAVAVVFIGLAAIGNWIAFGAGPRACSAGVSASSLGVSSGAVGMGCRVPFGVGAVILDAIIVMAALMWVARRMENPVWSQRLESVGMGILGVAVSPLILVAILMSAWSVIRERLWGRRS